MKDLGVIKEIVSSDEFTNLPISARYLYVYLYLFADEKGYINSLRSTARMIGASEDDVQLLLDNEYILETDLEFYQWKINFNKLKGEI